jgi:small subunit ribosomal protein S9
MAEDVYAATGRRKEAAARVRLSLGGSGRITINGRSIEEYLPRVTDRTSVFRPLDLVEMRDKFDISCNAKGGGNTGQADAIAHGISRALVEFDPELRSVLKQNGMLTRDPREKERKKYGLAGARKRFQFSKR